MSLRARISLWAFGVFSLLVSLGGISLAVLGYGDWQENLHREQELEKTWANFGKSLGYGIGADLNEMLCVFFLIISIMAFFAVLGSYKLYQRKRQGYFLLLDSWLIGAALFMFWNDLSWPSGELIVPFVGYAAFLLAFYWLADVHKLRNDGSALH